jgi:WD repeat-containing protein 44
MLMKKNAGPLSSTKLATRLRSPTSPTAQPTDQPSPNGRTESQQQAEAHIDPLSQVCTQRAMLAVRALG